MAHFFIDRSEVMEIEWRQIGRIRKMRIHFPMEPLNCFLHHIDDLGTGIIVLEDDSITTLRSSLLDSFVQWSKLLKVKLPLYYLIPIERLAVGCAFLVSPNAKYCPRLIVLKEVFELSRQIQSSSSSYNVFSVHGSNMASSFYDTLIKGKGCLSN